MISGVQIGPKCKMPHRKRLNIVIQVHATWFLSSSSVQMMVSGQTLRKTSAIETGGPHPLTQTGTGPCTRGVQCATNSTLSFHNNLLLRSFKPFSFHITTPTVAFSLQEPNMDHMHALGFVRCLVGHVQDTRSRDRLARKLANQCCPWRKRYP